MIFLLNKLNAGSNIRMTQPYKEQLVVPVKLTKCIDKSKLCITYTADAIYFMAYSQLSCDCCSCSG